MMEQEIQKMCRKYNTNIASFFIKPLTMQEKGH